MLRKLTKKQEALIPEIRAKWLKKMFSLPETKEKEAIKGIKWLYKFAGLKEPFVIVLDSPLACQYATTLINKKILDSAQEIESKIDSEIDSETWLEVDSKIGTEIQSKIHSQIESEVDSKIGSEIWSKIKSKIKSKVPTTFGYGDISDFYWVAFYDYFREIGIVKNKNFDKFLKLMDCGIFSAIQFSGIALLSRMPTELHTDHKGRLHNLNGKAIKFKDGFGLYFVNGVGFDKNLFEKAFIKKSITGREILKLKNTEQKAAIMIYGQNIINKNIWREVWKETHL